MVWQDVVIGAGDYIFFIALLPSIFSRDKPALSSSLLTGTILIVFAFTFTTLHLWNSAFGSLLVGIAWFVLAIQKYRTKRTQRIGEYS